MAVKKVGPISDEDRKYIIAHLNDKTVEEIAIYLGKNPKVIEKEIKNFVDLPTAENETVRWHLKKMPEWKHLRQEFTPEELNLIEDKYVKYIEQMDDVLATEESQVLNMIKIEILMGRNLKGRMKLMDSAKNLESMKQSILDRVEGNFGLLSEADRTIIMEIENSINSNANIETGRTRQYVELQQELNAIHAKLKTSRDQRLDKVLDSKLSFTTYIKDLMERDKQESESRFIQLMGIAVNKEESRLSQAHKYADGSYDNPILSAEILDILDKEDKELLLKEENKNETAKPVS